MAHRALDRVGGMTLPAPRHAGCGGRPVGLGAPVAAPSGVPDAVDRVSGLSLQLVESGERRRLWTELVAREHPRGSAIHAGRHLRYLIASDHGVLGAVGVAAASLRLAARDAWIGWDAEARSRSLDHVAQMTRFLIRPMVACEKLASHALGLRLRCFGDDFVARYGYCPALLETFVDPSVYDGASLRTANWTRVGATTGRRCDGRAKDWRARLGGVETGLRPLQLGTGLDGE